MQNQTKMKPHQNTIIRKHGYIYNIDENERYTNIITHAQKQTRCVERFCFGLHPTQYTPHLFATVSCRLGRTDKAGRAGKASCRAGTTCRAGRAGSEGKAGRAGCIN